MDVYDLVDKYNLIAFGYKTDGRKHRYYIIVGKNGGESELAIVSQERQTPEQLDSTIQDFIAAGN